MNQRATGKIDVKVHKCEVTRASSMVRDTHREIENGQGKYCRLISVGWNECSWVTKQID